jgi:hypothetical protein
VSAKTQVFIVVSSGRSGTAMLQKALAASSDIEIHHEYMVHLIQPLAVRRYLGLATESEARTILAQTYEAAIRCSDAAHWGDSSNKASWLIDDLAELLPRAKFIHLARDGRKVASSYLHKLGAECYDDRSTAILGQFLDDPAHNPPPPPEKKYWWPVPRKTDPLSQKFRAFDQFERIAWHWVEINRVILDSLARLAPSRSHFVRLEDLRASPEAVKELYRFLGLAYRTEHFAAFARPHNVNRPEDTLLDARQRVQFDAIASPMMDRLGYASEAEYVVNY